MCISKLMMWIISKKAAVNFFLIFFAIHLSSRHEKRCQMCVRLFCLFQCPRNQQWRHIGCLNMNCQTSNLLSGIKNTLLSHKNNICTFMRCGNLTYDTCIWLKITSLSSTASVLKDGRISLEIPSFCSEIYFFHNIKIRWF